MSEDSQFGKGESPSQSVCDCGKAHPLVDAEGNKDSKAYVFSDGRTLVAKASDGGCKVAVASSKAV